MIEPEDYHQNNSDPAPDGAVNHMGSQMHDVNSQGKIPHDTTNLPHLDETREALNG